MRSRVAAPRQGGDGRFIEDSRHFGRIALVAFFVVIWSPKNGRHEVWYLDFLEDI